MSDHSELKRLALEVDAAKCADESEYGRRLDDFYEEVTPEEVLELLNENEALRAAATTAAKKLRSAEICHPRAVETLVAEARQVLAEYLPAEWPHIAEVANG